MNDTATNIKSASMKSSSTDIEKVAQNFLKEKNIAFVSIDKPVFSPGGKMEGLIAPDYWTVSYEYKVFGIEQAFIKIDDQTQKIIHVTTKHGYEYINGENKVKDEDDGEDWSDL